MTKDEYEAACEEATKIDSFERDIETIEAYGFAALRVALTRDAAAAVKALVLNDVKEQLAAAKKRFEEL